MHAPQMALMMDGPVPESFGSQTLNEVVGSLTLDDEAVAAVPEALGSHTLDEVVAVALPKAFGSQIVMEVVAAVPKASGGLAWLEVVAEKAVPEALGSQILMEVVAAAPKAFGGQTLLEVVADDTVPKALGSQILMDVLAAVRPGSRVNKKMCSDKSTQIDEETPTSSGSFTRPCADDQPETEIPHDPQKQHGDYVKCVVGVMHPIV